jgi:hypothetical protein
LLIQQNFFSDGEAASSSVYETAKHTQSLGGFLSDLDDLRLPGQALV